MPPKLRHHRSHRQDNKPCRRSHEERSSAGLPRLLQCPVPRLKGQSTTPFLSTMYIQLNPTELVRIETPATLDELRKVLASARSDQLPVCIAGGRHAMGGQQFVSGGVMVDTRQLNRVLNLDVGSGIVEVEAGIQWPALIDHLLHQQRGLERVWTIPQKQTGADRLCLGGCLSANVHGRGLAMKPFVADVESFSILTAGGNLRTCSRSENSELFRLAIGGYGLFGTIYSVQLRLLPRRKLRRVVEVTNDRQRNAAFRAAFRCRLSLR